MSTAAVASDALAWTRADFPLLRRTIDGRPITYLDSASTAPKPEVVIEAVTQHYRTATANVHRGVHVLSEEATEAFERARQDVAAFINAQPSEIVFTHNSTDAVNLVARGLALQPDDEVVLPALEHHSNFMPWRVHGRAVTIALDEEGAPRYDALEAALSPRTRLVALAHVSNTLGVVAPVAAWIAAAHARGLPALVDVSQSISHLPLDVRALDCDFMVFSGHKMLGPTGVGVLYGRRAWLERLALGNVGGGMVAYHGDERFTPRDIPWRFEAGTPAIEGVIGLGAAVGYLQSIGMTAVAAHSRALGRRLVEGLRAIPGTRILADSAPWDARVGLASFTVPVAGLTAEGVARALCDRRQILVSGGYHCAHILHHRLGLAGTVRASTHVFNTRDDIDRLLAALRELTGA